MRLRKPAWPALVAVSTLLACETDSHPPTATSASSSTGTPRAPSASSSAPSATPAYAIQKGKRLLAALEKGQGVASWPAIIERLQALTTSKQRNYLLVGHYHDSGGQLAAFTRLVGPRGLDIRTVALEHFDTNAQLGPYLRGKDGGPELSRLVDGRYTAWKYGYTEQLWGLLDMARAHDVKVVGCDMPAPQVEAERDAHCGRAVAKLESRRIALFYGAAHLEQQRLPSRLTGRVTRVQLFGRRPPGARAEAGLPFRLTDPVMVELDGVHHLLLDGPLLGAKLDRVRLDDAAAGLSLRGPGRLLLGGQPAALNRTDTLEARTSPFVYRPPEGRGPVVVGGVTKETALLDFVEPGVVRIESRKPKAR